MTLSAAVKMSLARYASFSGRARRSEYWYVTLCQLLAMPISYLVWRAIPTLAITLYALFVLGTVVPHMALSVRRLHDVNRTGWWYLLGLVPFLGGIVLLVWFCTDGTSGSNRFGADPKATGSAAGTHEERIAVRW